MRTLLARPALGEVGRPPATRIPRGHLRPGLVVVPALPLIRSQAPLTGTATHSSHEFFTLKHRLFRHLVHERGFSVFSLEIAWSSGLRLNEYVLHGKGDPERILREEFVLWNTGEYLALVRWMSDYNRHHARKILFSGNDISYAGKEVFAPVLRHAARRQPALLATYQSLYADLGLGRSSCPPTTATWPICRTTRRPTRSCRGSSSGTPSAETTSTPASPSTTARSTHATTPASGAPTR